jgi:glycine/D-amino acid oxidase-like deaminating enzyme/nitrite reductase/ring-hydroxylating ferredoxin subunit
LPIEHSSPWGLDALVPRNGRAWETDARHGEVVVVGAGLTGLLTALRLAEAGKEVLVLEAGAAIGGGETGATTAHVTSVIDLRYAGLVSGFGRDNAILALSGQGAALAEVRELAGRIGPEAELEIKTGFLFGDGMAGEAKATVKQVQSLERERQCAIDLGVKAAFSAAMPLPFPTMGGLVIPEQLSVNPAGFMRGLLRLAEAAGVRFVLNVRVNGVKGAHPVELKTSKGIVTAGDVVFATHVPVHAKVAFHTKLEAFRTYALAAPLTVADPGLESGLFWDLDEPYHYIRTAAINGKTHLIVGGEDHRVGAESDTPGREALLYEYFQKRFSIVAGPVTHMWSGQVVETADGLPLAGCQALHGDDSHLYLATGYAGNGFTHGVLAAGIISEQILGRKTPWDDLLKPGRAPLRALGRYLSNNAETVGHLIGDATVGLGADVATIRPGEGAVVRRQGAALAIFRDPGGALQCLSAICPHLGCTVNWNSAEKSWDCPCHGSRFTCEGRVINGPATKDLKPEKLSDHPADPDGAAAAESMPFPPVGI